MGGALAIVSKAAFEAVAKTARPGETVALDRYTSTHKTLDTLAGGGALFLVTVRPPDEALWLVAILDAPNKKADGWYAKVNTTPIADITALIPELVLATGQGITAKKGALAMSLQTPRALADQDVALLRAATGGKRGKVAKATKPTKPTNATKRTSSSSRNAPALDLRAIATALDDNDASAALDAALLAWRQTRAPALADLVDVISSKIDAPAIDGDVVWSQIARSKAASDVGALLAAIPTLPASFLPTAGDALEAFPDDPRIAMATAAWTLDPPTTSSSTHPFWTKTIEAMTRAADPRVVPVLKKRLKMKPGGSKFWPRLYGALEKALAKIEAASVVAIDDKAVGKLAKAAHALAAVKPAKPAKVATAAKAPTLAGPPLARATEHLGAGRVQAGIDALLDAWRAHDRVPAIADAIDRATRLLPAWDRALGATDKEVIAAWDAAFAEDPQAAMPQLLDHLLAGGPAHAERRLVALAGLADDPRIAMRLAELTSGRAASPERTQFWKSLLELVARIRDPRTAAGLCRAFGDFQGDYYNHHRQARRIIGEWAKNPPVPPQLGPRDTEALAKIDKALAKLEDNVDTTERDLLKAVAEAWDDNGPRLVYADWLTERQHPRGETIVLACKDKRTPAEDKRLRDLLRKTTNLYGAIDAFATNYTDDRQIGLDRGLPTLISIDWWTSTLAWRRLVGMPMLQTIASIQLADRGQLPLATDLARIANDPLARRLTAIKSVPKDYAPKLAAALGEGWRAKGKDLVRS